MISRAMTLMAAMMMPFVSCSQATRVDDAGLDGSHEADTDPDGPTKRPIVDVLCVLDSDRYGSPSEGRDMANHVLGPFLKQLADESGITGDQMRVGVITPNLGAPGLPVCDSDDGTSWSDEGILVSLLSEYQRRVRDGCEDLGPYFTADSVEEYGGCYFDVDSWPEGCPYLQFLRAPLISFDRPENEIFFRPDAHVLVIIFANRDDCSFEDGSFLHPELGRVSSEVSCVTHGEDLLSPPELARSVSEEVGDRGLTVVLFGGEDHPVRIAEDEHGFLVPVYEPCEGGGTYDHVTPTPRIHDFLDELTLLRDDPGLTFRFDTCFMLRWTEEDKRELVEQLADRLAWFR